MKTTPAVPVNDPAVKVYPRILMDRFILTLATSYYIHWDRKKVEGNRS